MFCFGKSPPTSPIADCTEVMNYYGAREKNLKVLSMFMCSRRGFLFFFLIFPSHFHQGFCSLFWLRLGLVLTGYHYRPTHPVEFSANSFHLLAFNETRKWRWKAFADWRQYNNINADEDTLKNDAIAASSFQLYGSILHRQTGFIRRMGLMGCFAPSVLILMLFFV